MSRSGRSEGEPVEARRERSPMSPVGHPETDCCGRSEKEFG